MSQLKAVSSNSLLFWGPDDSHARISFQLHSPDVVPYPSKFFGCPNYLCNGDDRVDLLSSLSNRLVLNFTTSVSTDLNVLFLGDSLSRQFVEAFDATLVPQGQGDVRHDKLNFVAAGKGRLSKHGCLVSTAPVRGSGSTALLFQDTN